MYYPQSNHIIEVDDITNVQHVYVTLEDGKPILYIKASLDPRKDYLHKKLAKTAHLHLANGVSPRIFGPFNHREQLPPVVEPVPVEPDEEENPNPNSFVLG